MPGWPICSARTSLDPRLRENQHVLREGYAAMSIAAIARHLRTGETMIVKGGGRLGRHDETLSAPVRLVVSGSRPANYWRWPRPRVRHALARYRQRWTIETVTSAISNKGFAFEATHDEPGQTMTSLALMAFAVA